MKQPDWTAERAEVERVAQEYRARGYDVVVSPSVAELPDFIRDYAPDIIARGPRESVVIEVKHRDPAADRGRLRAIAEKVERQPGWRFVVVSASPAGGPPWLEDFRPLDLHKARRMLSEAEALKSTGHREAAVLMYWSALEAAMRVAARRHALEIPRPDTWSLMRELVSNGVLDRDTYQQLNEFFRLRSALAHGLEPADHVDLERVSAMLHETAASLLRDAEQPDSETRP